MPRQWTGGKRRWSRLFPFFLFPPFPLDAADNAASILYGQGEDNEIEESARRFLFFFFFFRYEDGAGNWMPELPLFSGWREIRPDAA